MELINIKGTDDTPNVILDKDNAKFEISGRSLPEDVNMFYEPILEWIDSYAEAPCEKTEFNFKLEYFNSSSAKFIADILVMVEKYHSKGFDLKIYWYFDEGDDDMKELGDDLKMETEFPFEYIAFE